MCCLQRFLVLGACLFAGGTTLGAPRERDTWHVYAADGKQYGSVHTRVVQLADGNYRITRESRMLVDLAPGKETIEERATYVVTPAYRPISIDIEGKQGSGETRVTGRFRDGRFEVKATVAGIERERTLARVDDIVPIPCLDDWLTDRPPAFERGEVMLLDDELWERQSAQVRRLNSDGSGTSWSVDRGPAEGELRIVLDADGLLRQSTFTSDVGVLRRGSTEEAQNLSYLKTDSRDMLTFPLGVRINDAGRLVSLTVELRWKDIDLDRFRLDADGQTMVESSADGGRYRAVVKINIPEPVTKPLQLPVDGADFARYLGESRYILPRDPRIVAVAREVVGNRTDALEAVRALSDWVCRNVEPAGVAETLTGPEVLACRKGKCTEYATLFASLARAVGIPTRIALGERMVPGQWAGHMWNEVYVGRWISVDAGANEVGSSLALLKLIDHETVEGTQPLRFALPASLDIKILDHLVKPAALAGKFQTGIAGGIYTNAEFGCRMAAPDAGWSLEEKEELSGTTIRFKIPVKGSVSLHFVAFPLPVAIEPKVLLGRRLAVYKSRKDFEVLTEEKSPVNGLPGDLHTFRYTSAKGQLRRVHEVMWRKPSSGYLLTLDAEESAFDEAKASVSALLMSFEDLDQK